jgi:RNA polymerase sigma-70 factor (ECF subfamily)
VTQDNTKLDVFMTHRAALVDYATPIVGCPARAEDVVQDAYLRFAQRPEMGEDQALRQPLAYLYRVVRNVALDCVRRMSAEARRDKAQEILAPMATTAPSPEDIAVSRDGLRQIETALADLPDRARRAFELHRFEGLTFQQIAERLDISPASAHRLTRDAMVHLMRRRAVTRD